MSILVDPPRGGIVEKIDGQSYVFLLRNREIERFEDKHRGIFQLWDAFFDRADKPTSKEVKDLLALALVGGGMSENDADSLIEGASPDKFLQFYQVAQAVLGVAFMPDLMNENSKKKTKGHAKQNLTSVG